MKAAPRGKDGDHIDVFIGPNPEIETVYVINQHKEDGGAFDEHKCMLCFASKEKALAAYDKAFSDGLGPKLRKSVSTCSLEQFKEWLESGDHKNPCESVAESILQELLYDDLEGEPVEEVAADFIENEVGRFDWINNWAKFKEKHDAFVKVRQYLATHRINASPEEVISEIERMVKFNPGKWV